MPSPVARPHPATVNQSLRPQLCHDALGRQGSHSNEFPTSQCEHSTANRLLGLHPPAWANHESCKAVLSECFHQKQLPARVAVAQLPSVHACDCRPLKQVCTVGPLVARKHHAPALATAQPSYPAILQLCCTAGATAVNSGHPTMHSPAQ